MCSLSRPSCSCCFFCTLLRLLLPPLLLLHSATIFWVSDTGWYPSLWGCSDGSRHRSNAYVDVQGLSLLAHTSQLVLAFLPCTQQLLMCLARSGSIPPSPSLLPVSAVMQANPLCLLLPSAGSLYLWYPWRILPRRFRQLQNLGRSLLVDAGSGSYFLHR